MDFIGELVFQVVLFALNITLGIGLAGLSYWLWVMVRRRLWHLDRPLVIEAPDGGLYSLEVPGLRVRTPVSTRIFRPRRSLAGPPPGWTKDDRLHPDRVVGCLDDLLIFVVPFLLAGVLVLVLLFVLEVILAIVVLGIAAIVATVIRHRWSCVITSPEGRTFRSRARGMRGVRRLRDATAAAIKAGDLPALERANEA